MFEKMIKRPTWRNEKCSVAARPGNFFIEIRVCQRSCCRKRECAGPREKVIKKLDMFPSKLFRRPRLDFEWHAVVLIADIQHVADLRLVLWKTHQDKLNPRY